VSAIDEEASDINDVDEFAPMPQLNVVPDQQPIFPIAGDLNSNINVKSSNNEYHRIK